MTQEARSIDFDVKPLIPPELAAEKGEPLILEIKCKRCGEHLGYYGDKWLPADSPRVTQAIALILDVHRIGHFLEDLVTKGIQVDQAPPMINPEGDGENQH